MQFYILLIFDHVFKAKDMIICFCCFNLTFVIASFLNFKFELYIEISFQLKVIFPVA